MSVFYKIDSTRITLREYWWGTKSPLILLAALIKLLRIPIPSSTDDPPVESLQPFEVAETTLPEEVRARFTAITEEFRQAGFHSPIFHAIHDSHHATKIYWATFLHPSGQACARIHHRIWSHPQPPKRHLFPIFFSSFSDGTFLISSGGKPDMAAPAEWRVEHRTGKNATTLWEWHQQFLQEESLRRALAPVRSRVELIATSERQHAALRDFHLQRGVFVAMNAREQQRAVFHQTAAAAEVGGEEHAEVLAELEKLQHAKPGWGNAVLILVVSALLFIGAGSSQWSWQIALLLIPILFFHELGHYVAMRLFKYRNMRMFFIPFFGAAVSGQNYNVPGWKKAIVSLMGPLPGILLGAILGCAGLIAHQPFLIKAGLMTLVLNAFNLVPVLPFDGGWVLHAVLFSRRPLFDVGFRLAAVIALFVIGSWSRDRILMFIGIPMLIGLPAVYRMARIAEKFRRSGSLPPPLDTESDAIPVPTARAIITEVKAAFPRGQNNKSIAQYTLNIFETLNAHPPGWLATAAFLAVHFGSVLMAVVFLGVFVLAQHGDLKGVLAAAAQTPKRAYECGTIRSWGGSESSETLARPQSTIITSFKKHSAAQAAFNGMTNRLAGDATLKLFGETLFLSLPADDEAGRQKWVTQLMLQSTNLLVHRTNFLATFSLTCIAPTEPAARGIEEEINAYFTASFLHLVPPWAPQPAVSTNQRAARIKARLTYWKLEQGSTTNWSGPEMRDLQRRTAQAVRRGDDAEARRLRNQQTRLQQELAARHLESLRREGADKVDLKIIDLYSNLPTNRWANTNYVQELQKLGVPMGQLAMAGEHPAPGEDRYSTRWGSISRQGLILQFTWLSFPHPADGVPALAEWLCAKGCLDLKYDFHLGGSPDLSDENEE